MRKFKATTAITPYIPAGEDPEAYSRLPAWQGAPGGAEGAIEGNWRVERPTEYIGGRTANTQTSYTVNSLVDNFAIPALKSLLLALAAFIFGGVAGWVFEAPGSVSWRLAAGFGAVTLLVSMLMSFDQTQWFFERLTGLDLNGDHWRGNPNDRQPADEQPQRSNAELVTVAAYDPKPADGGGACTTYLSDLPKAVFTEFAQVMTRASDPSFSTGDWVRAGRFIRPDFNKMRDRMIDAGLAVWKGNGHNSGVMLTEKGRITLKNFLEKTGQTPPDYDNEEE